MSDDWFLMKDGQRLGPYSADELRARARAGQLLATSLLWREGMGQPVAAEVMEGVFGRGSFGQPERVSAEDEIVFAEAAPDKQSENRGVIDCLKSAGASVASQAEITRIQTITLPAAFRKLGEAVYQSGACRGDLRDEYAAADHLRQEIEERKESRKGAPSPQGVVGRADAAAKAFADTAILTVQQAQLNSAHTALGKAAYRRRGELAFPRELFGEVEGVYAKLRSLRESVPQSPSGAPSGSLLDNRIVHVALMPFCFPVGLVLVFMSKSWSKRAKVTWAAALIALMMFGYVVSAVQSQAMKSELAEANSIWHGGRKSDAVDQYRTILDRYWITLDDSDRTTLIRRVVESDLDHGNVGGATRIIERAIRDRIDVSFDDRRAVGIAESLQAKTELTRRAEQRAQSVTSPETVIGQLHAGMSEDDVVSMLGQPIERRGFTEPIMPQFGLRGAPGARLIYEFKDKKSLELEFKNGVLVSWEQGTR